MPVQLIMLRADRPEDEGVKGKRKHRFTKPPIEAESHKELFEKIEEFIGKIDEKDRWNIYYTVPNCAPGKIREMLSQDIMAFDVDGVNKDRIDDYLPIVADQLALPEDTITVVESGNGLHFLVQLTFQYQRDDIPQLQPHYKEIIKRMEQACKNAGLTGKFDMILDSGRILRLPLTENRKPGKPTTQCRIRQCFFVPQPLDIKKLSGIPDVAPEDAIPAKDFQRLYPKVDNKTVLAECQFLRWVRECPSEVREPQGYAALSILSRFEDGPTVAKNIAATWTNSSSIASWDLEQKIEQALVASGPRTCKNLDVIADKCKGCPHQGKVISPIAIQGPDFIATEGSGFYTIWFENGDEKKRPNYEDLLRAFVRDTNYFFQAQGSQIWAFEKTHYRALSDHEVKAYAERMFDPSPTESMRLEFLAKVKANRIKSDSECADFWTRTTTGKVNLGNGVYDLATRTLGAHTPEYGFRYVLPYGFDPSATAPRFSQFLDEVTLNRKVFRDVLLDCMGASLVPGYDFDAGFWWFQGRGRNGKSRLLKTMQMLLGKHNTTVMDPTSLAGDAARFRLGDMDGKLLTIIEEVNEKHLGSRLLGVIKNISAGGDIKVEKKNKPSYDMPATSKLIFTANTSPILEDVTPAVKRRFIVVPFDLDLMDPACPVKADTGLGDKIQLELPGIFNMALQALEALRARGQYFTPEESKQLLNKMARNSDSVENWLYRRVDQGPHAGEPRLKFKEAYQDYVTFVDGDAPVSKRTFSARLEEKLGKVGECRNMRFPDGSKVDGFIGLKLRDPNEPGAEIEPPY